MCFPRTKGRSGSIRGPQDDEALKPRTPRNVVASWEKYRRRSSKLTCQNSSGLILTVTQKGATVMPSKPKEERPLESPIGGLGLEVTQRMRWVRRGHSRPLSERDGLAANPRWAWRSRGNGRGEPHASNLKGLGTSDEGKSCWLRSQSAFLD